MKDFFETKKGILVLNFAKYLAFFACLYLFCIGGIRDEIFPFAFGFYIALCWCDQNVFLMSLLYVGANLLAGFSVPVLVQSLSTVAIFVVCYFAHIKLKRRIPTSLLCIYAIISQTMYLYYNLTSVAKIVPCILYLLFGVLFMLSSINILKVILVKGIGLRRTIDENICICAFFVALGSGLASANFCGFQPINAVAVLLILMCTYVFASLGVPLVVAFSLGLGYALQSGSLLMMSALLTLAVASISFKTTNRYFSIMAIIICDVVLGLYFNAYGIYSYKILLSTIVGESLFLCVSNSTLALAKTLFAQKNGTTAIRNMVNRSRDNLCKKMFSLSEVFDEMDRSFKSTITSTLPANEAKQMLKEELLNKVCYDCPEKHRCHRVLQKETNEVLDALIATGLDRGKVSYLDIPPFLSTRCAKTNILLNVANQLVSGYKQYAICKNSVDTSKALVAEEFKGVSRLLLKLADDTKELVTFNEELEQKIIEELNYANIFASEVYVFEKQGQKVSCVLTLRNTDVQSENLTKIINKNLGTKMVMQASEPSAIAGYTIATFAQMPKFDCIYGSAGATKFGGEVSGDSYSFIRLNGNKILLAVCDGMGSGESAQKISDTTISLIENFYRAEFDDETILSSVNKLLTMQLSDNYSALDICVLDLNNALGDFIKVGAPASFIRHSESTEILTGSGALPIGILQEIKPSIDKKCLEAGDIVVLCSDGIIDAFDDIETLKNFVNNIQSNNPQEIADIVTKQAIQQIAGQPKDDMTVLCARIYLNI